MRESSLYTRSTGVFLILAATLLLNAAQVLAASPAETEAQSSFQKKNFAKVVEVLSVPMEQLSVGSLKMLARAHQELRQWDKAQRVLEYLKEKAPRDHLVSLNLARVYLEQNLVTEGLAEYKRTTEIQPQFFPAYQEQLKYLEKSGRIADMRPLLMDMAQQFGERKEIINGLCRAYYEEGYIEQSKSYCQKAIMKDENNPNSYVYLGLTHKNSGDSGQATEWIAKASQRFPASEMAQWAAGELELEKGNYLGAEAHLLKAKKLEPTSVRVLKALAAAQFQLGKYQDALNHYSQWCSIEKRVPDEFKKAAGLLLSEQPEWHRKYNSQIARCNG
jgi:tetratricopeptide (TPR) repeat protein